MPSGGKREGAGRKSKRDKYAPKINTAEKKIADRLPEFVENIIFLATGGFEQFTQVFEPAGTIMVDAVTIETNGQGNPVAVKTKERAFPDLPADEMVVTKITKTISVPDLAANTYLLNRIMGLPTQPHEFTNMTDAEILEAATAAFGGSDPQGTETSAD